MNNVLLAIIPGITYAALVDGMAGLSFQQFTALILVGVISFMILIKSLDAPSNTRIT